jgi:hypothetical protein
VLQRTAFQDLHIAAVHAGDRYERVGEPIARIVDFDWIITEVARNLRPGRIKGFPDCLQGIWPERSAVYKLSSAHDRRPTCSPARGQIVRDAQRDDVAATREIEQCQVARALLQISLARDWGAGEALGQ